MASDATSPRKRPWYLTLALVVCILFGGSIWWEGCGTIYFFRQPADPAEIAQGIDDGAKRAAVIDIGERYLTKIEAAKNRLFPLGVASFVLGLAMVVLATRALAGRGEARSMLLQILGAQAVLGIVAFLLTPDVRHAQSEYLSARIGLELAEMRQTNPGGGGAAFYAAVMGAFLKVFPGLVAVPTALCGLIVLALTRPRARAFFEAEAEPASER